MDTLNKQMSKPFLGVGKNEISSLMPHAGEWKILGICSYEGVIESVHHAFEELTGFTKKELLSSLIEDWFSFEENIYTNLSTTKEQGIPCQVKTREGNRTMIWVSFVEVHAPEKKSIILLLNPTTPQVLQKEYERNLSMMLEGASNVMFLLDESFNVKVANQKALELFESIMDNGHDFSSMPIIDLLDNKIQRGFKLYLQKALTGKCFKKECEIRFQNGTKAWFEIKITPFDFQYNLGKGVLIAAKDISDAVYLKEALAESQIHFHSIFEQVNVGIQIMNMQMETLKVNTSLAQMLGYTPSELTRLDANNLIHPHDMKRLKENYTQLCEENTLKFDMEVRLIHRNGNIVWVYLSAATVNNEKSKPRYVISVFKDISALKATTEQLNYRTKELHDFIYRSSHDIRGPVASLLGLSDLAGKEVQDSLAKFYLGMIYTRAQMLDNVISDLIKITSIKDSELFLEKINFGSMIKEVIAEVQHLDTEQKIKVHIHIDTPVPFYADASLLKNALLHLLKNSFTFHKKNESSYVSISIRNKDAHNIVIHIEDNGDGIAPEFEHRIFDMFSRGSLKSKGSGLGLYMVKNSIDKMQGNIDFFSVYGKGTSFKITLPCGLHE